ncbi:IclR family transcriptional regulator C-terminal domain-containing protein [Spirillospora sp. NPDC048819]|uniref:IclR family transcriptional regulator n=1 Tax=Spirillospora sp. NPDC048819 TaxID=3155268 RepID=UPI0034013025
MVESLSSRFQAFSLPRFCNADKLFCCEEQTAVALLRAVCEPHLRWLVKQTEESANVVVRLGNEARFIATVQSEHVLRVGDRVGVSLPAHLASGGKAILAALPPGEVADLYKDGDVDLPRLHRELGLVRRRGFAINDQLTETGLIAIGVLVRDESGAPLAGLSVALPTARFDRDALPGWVSTLTTAARRIEAAMTRQR